MKLKQQPQMQADPRRWLKSAAIWLLPYPIGWLSWLTVYCSSVSHDGLDITGENFWWDEAIFVALCLGTLTALPFTALTGLIAFLRMAKSRIDNRPS